jgi:hypothetical protein
MLKWFDQPVIMVATLVAVVQKLQLKLQQFYPPHLNCILFSLPSLGCNCNHPLTTPSIRNCNGEVLGGGHFLSRVLTEPGYPPKL